MVVVAGLVVVVALTSLDVQTPKLTLDQSHPLIIPKSDHHLLLIGV